MSRRSVVYLKNKMVLLMTAGCEPKPLFEKCLIFNWCVSLTGVEALGDCGWFNQVASTQVTGDEMIKVSH